eukprot:SAG11_NODE_12852_length_682_cov_1.152659_1_plen_56_part_01
MQVSEQYLLHPAHQVSLRPAPMHVRPPSVSASMVLAGVGAEECTIRARAPSKRRFW